MIFTDFYIVNSFYKQIYTMPCRDFLLCVDTYVALVSQAMFGPVKVNLLEYTGVSIHYFYNNVTLKRSLDV